MITSVGEEGAGLCASRAFVYFVRVIFCHFSLPAGVRVGCGLRLWHSLDFPINSFLICSSQHVFSNSVSVQILLVMFSFMLTSFVLYMFYGII